MADYNPTTQTFRPPPGPEKLEFALWRIDYLVVVVDAKLVLVSKMITNPNEPIIVKCDVTIVELIEGTPARRSITLDWVEGELYHNEPTAIAGKKYIAGDLFEAANIDQALKGLRTKTMEWVAKNGG